MKNKVKRIPHKETETAPSMRAAAGRLKIPFHVVQAAQRDGCPAFLGSGRVDLPVLASWIITQDVAREIQAIRFEDGISLEDAARKWERTPKGEALCWLFSDECNLEQETTEEAASC